MRITSAVVQREALAGLQRNLRPIQELQEQIATGERVRKPSDDPVAIGSIIESTGKLGAIDQYRRNLDTAASRLALEDSVLNDLTNAMGRARELATQQGSGTANAQTRAIAQAEVDELIGFARNLGNTQLAGHFIFGGDYADTLPFPPGGPSTVTPPQGEQQIEIGENQRLSTTHSGQEAFLDTGVFDALDELSTALGANDQDGVLTALQSLDNAFDAVQEVIGETGARMNSVDMASENLDALEVNLETFRSSLKDADIETAVTELVSRQTTFEAAMLANARILNLSLNDYLR